MNHIEFCHTASKTMTPKPTDSDFTKEIGNGFSKIFLSLGEDFEEIAKMVMKDFTDKEITSIITSFKKDSKKPNTDSKILEITSDG